MSYSKLCDTFRASDCTAVRTQLGSHPFVGFGVHHSALLGLVREHVPEARPAGVQHGLRHPRLGQLGRAHIADDDVCELAHERRRLLVQEMLSRVDDLGVYRLGAGFVASTLRNGDLEILPAKRQVRYRGEQLDFTALEFDLLLHFAQHPGHVFSRGQLLNAVWGYSHDGYEHTVTTHINRLRNKLEADPMRPELILTVRGAGYKQIGRAHV